MTKLILTAEVTELGSTGDVVEVKDGYARNYLLPRRLAMPWTKGGEKQIKSIQKARDVRASISLEEAQMRCKTLNSQVLRLVAKAGESGRLFGTIMPADVAQALAQAGLGTIDKRSIDLPEHIKRVGMHKAMVRLHAEVVAELKLEVVAEL